MRYRRRESTTAQCLAVLLIGGLTVATTLAVYSMVSTLAGRPKPAAEPAAQPELTRHERIEAQFNGWDGSHRKLTGHLKTLLRDPNSFECAETRWEDRSRYILVDMRYRSRNGFGGMTLGRIRAKVDLDGNILEIVILE